MAKTDKQNYTPEEEAYLRMLDLEVPDLWGRIEAGLDRAEAGKQQPTREERFLASQYAGDAQDNGTAQNTGTAWNTGNTGNTGNAQNLGNRRPRTWIIAGVAAAAAVLIISLAIFGFSKREISNDAATSDTASYNQAISDSQKSKGSATAEMEAAEETDNLQIDTGVSSNKNQSRREDKYSDNTLSGDSWIDSAHNLVPEKSESADGGSDSIPTGETTSEASRPEDAQEARDVEKQEEQESEGDITSQPHFLQAKAGEECTLIELAKRMTIDTSIRVYRMEEGVPVAYLIAHVTFDDKVELIPESMANDVIAYDAYQAAVLTLDGGSKVKAGEGIVEGEIVYYLQ